ncbi:serine hydroxymethyltransferase [Candidatus Peregrinibacteria bacterium]|nr:MAG: serine hydroxymethyltransferase [Candidatus Peregrinibacteria bacterium]
MKHPSLEQNFPEIYGILQKEMTRQKNGIELIPSENYTSQAVIEATGSHFTNKYSEGYPHKRYYGGQQFTDMIEEQAIEKAKKIFNAEHANVQPLSGAVMNIATYFALLEPGDTILGMDLSHGGHLTHGHPVTHMSKIFNFVRYKTDLSNDGKIDFDNLREMALKHKPKLILAGFSAYSRNLDWKKFKEIADEVGAITMADVSHIGGLIAGKVLDNPLDFGFDVMTTTTHKSLRGPRGGLILSKQKYAKAIDKAVFPGLQGGPLMHAVYAKLVCFAEADTPEFQTYSQQVLKNAKILCEELRSLGYTPLSGGTENHLIMIDITKNGLTGHEAETALDNAGMTLNKNMIPDDPRKPLDPSGIRLGTPAITTRGMKEIEMKKIAHFMDRAIRNHKDLKALSQIHSEITEMCIDFPVPGIE